MLDSQLEEPVITPGYVECSQCEELYPKRNGYISLQYPSYGDEYCCELCVDLFEGEMDQKNE